jgi:hypothetical protein
MACPGCERNDPEFCTCPRGRPVRVKGWLKKMLADNSRRAELTTLCRDLPDSKVAAATRAVRKVMKEGE